MMTHATITYAGVVAVKRCYRSTAMSFEQATHFDNTGLLDQRAPSDQWIVRKHQVVQVCENSIAAHRQDMKLEDSTHKLRARCIKKIEQALYYTRLRNRGETGVEFVNETSAINAVTGPDDGVVDAKSN